ncbi:hypothetical protein [Paenibacillus pectinilyticus]|nr:hypothetical protein [Paenibacillus pectinilyticus]
MFADVGRVQGVGFYRTSDKTKEYVAETPDWGDDGEYWKKNPQ